VVRFCGIIVCRGYIDAIVWSFHPLKGSDPMRTVTFTIH
jgi:hypothetical protein